MKCMFLGLFLMPSLATAGGGVAPDSEMSLGGVAIGETREAVVAKLGEPLRQQVAEDFLDLHYDYQQVRVSFNVDIVAALRSQDAGGCTPMRLCPGDGIERMHSLYGPPTVSDRDTGRFFEYYASDGSCWLEVPAPGRDGQIAFLSVVCLP